MLTTREIIEAALSLRGVTKQELATRLGRTKQAFGRSVLNERVRMDDMVGMLEKLDIEMRMFDRTDGTQITPGTAKEMYLEIINKRGIPNTVAGQLVNISGQAWRDQILLRQSVKGNIYMRLMDELKIDVRFYDKSSGQEVDLGPRKP